MRPDLVRLSELGLTTTDIGLMVRAAGDGAIIDEYHSGGEAIDLKIIAREAVGQETIGNLDDMPIATPSGRVVPLGSIAEIRFPPGTTCVQLSVVSRVSSRAVICSVVGALPSG